MIHRNTSFLFTPTDIHDTRRQCNCLRSYVVGLLKLSFAAKKQHRRCSSVLAVHYERLGLFAQVRERTRILVS